MKQSSRTRLLDSANLTDCDFTSEVPILSGSAVPQGDRRARLQVVAPHIKNGTVLFPRSGCEELLGQIFNIGVESHDDLNDALVYLLQGLARQGLELPKISWIEM